MINEVLSPIRWNKEGLITVIAQDHQSGKVLMLAWMNPEALLKTVETKKAHYYSRSRQKLWLKGKTSGHEQYIQSIHLDCDGDALLLKVISQNNIACHTGRESCFFRQWDGKNWQVTEPTIEEGRHYGEPRHIDCLARDD